jgi:hypothetical protein
MTGRPLGLSRSAPLSTVPRDPVDQRSLESDVVTDLLGFQPLMPQDLGFLGLKLPVKSGGCQRVKGLMEMFLVDTHG